MMNMPPTYGQQRIQAAPPASPFTTGQGGFDFETAVSLISLISSFTRR